MRPVLRRAPVLLVVLVVAACEARRVDLGGVSPEAGPVTAPQATPEPPAGEPLSGCEEWIDREMYALREGTCSGACNDPEGPSTWALASKKEVMAATAGSWLTCASGLGSFGPKEAVGVEFAPGCRLFFLQYDGDGALVRGALARFQARYDIVEPRRESAPRQIEVHFDETRSVTFGVEASRCPERVWITSGTERLELARTGAAAAIDPTK